jgi:heme/copper-type cytochrome/quinol oxidase subunit 2
VSLWHMTAYLIVLWIYERLGHTLPAEPTADWWAQRWLWLLAPLVILIVLIAVFARVETMVRRPRRKAEQAGE